DAGFRMDTVSIPAEGGELPNTSVFDPAFPDKFPADALYFMDGSDLAGTGVFDIVGFALQAAFSEDEVNYSSQGATSTPSPMSATPTVDEAYDQLSAMLGFNLKTDLFDQLNGEYGMYVNAADVMSDAPVI